MSKGTILLLEDDRLLAETIVELLELEGYGVTWVQDGSEAADAAYEGRYDLYLFDVNVPQIDGFSLLEGLREAADRTPTIYISALSDIASLARGFSLGAEDYIKKPFAPEELLIRVESRIASRRQLLACGRVTLDPASGEVRLEGQLLPLGEMLVRMLERFLRRPKALIERDELYECMEHPSANALRVAVTKLKQATGLDIRNVRGVGYILETC